MAEVRVSGYIKNHLDWKQSTATHYTISCECIMRFPAHGRSRSEFPLCTASTGFTDIKSGKIGGCSGVISGAGFSAVAGWDPATGLGTPNYESLLAFATSTA